jgi:adenosyl cobinamide kinase/adenosyl cobinamide phosphate guanylyltransferase
MYLQHARPARVPLSACSIVQLQQFVSHCAPDDPSELQPSKMTCTQLQQQLHSLSMELRAHSMLLQTHISHTHCVLLHCLLGQLQQFVSHCAPDDPSELQPSKMTCTQLRQQLHSLSMESRAHSMLLQMHISHTHFVLLHCLLGQLQQFVSHCAPDDPSQQQPSKMTCAQLRQQLHSLSMGSRAHSMFLQMHISHTHFVLLHCLLA